MIGSPAADADDPGRRGIGGREATVGMDGRRLVGDVPARIATTPTTAMTGPTGTDRRPEAGSGCAASGGGAPGLQVRPPERPQPPQRARTDAEQGEDHRVGERVVVVVRQVGDDGRPGSGRQERQREGRPEQPEPEPAGGLSLAERVADASRSRRSTAITTATARRGRPSRHRSADPTSGHDRTRAAETRKPSHDGSVRRRARRRRAGKSSGGPHLGEVVGQLVDDERHVADSGDDAEPGQARPPDRTSFRARRPPPRIGHEERRDHRQQDHPEHVALHRHRGPGRRDDPPRAGAGSSRRARRRRARSSSRARSGSGSR